MKLLILKTDIKTKRKVKAVKPILDSHPAITHWSVDLSDIDKVLRIEARDNTDETEVIKQINSNGFFCEELPD